ncbi:MAG: response regulator transcription factor [Oscillospiraceae bacterium]|nr:response regulator transcription factor [Blautia sp.]MBR3000766.1 response regulator transcription factor [Oscillospiraceae bacterium]
MKAGKQVVLIVEDDPKLRESMEVFLSGNKYLVLTAENGQEALDVFFLNSHFIDIILLDVMLPDMDGFEILKSIREYSQVPIIMTTAKEEEEDQLEGLINGADNYITKPFRLRILLAHMENLLNRLGKKSMKVTSGELLLDVESQQLYVKGEAVNTTAKEFALLMFFVKNKNKVLTRDAILDSVWGYDYDGDIRTVDTMVKQLRKKLTSDCPYIHSVYGLGYCYKETI